MKRQQGKGVHNILKPVQPSRNITFMKNRNDAENIIPGGRNNIAVISMYVS